MPTCARRSRRVVRTISHTRRTSTGFQCRGTACEPLKWSAAKTISRKRRKCTVFLRYASTCVSTKCRFVKNVSYKFHTNSVLLRRVSACGHRTSAFSIRPRRKPVPVRRLISFRSFSSLVVQALPVPYFRSR